MTTNKKVRILSVILVKGLLTVLLGIPLTITKPALAQAPSIDQEAWQPPEIQTLSEHPDADQNFKLSEAQEIKYKLYLETINQGLLYWDYRRLRAVNFCESSYRHEGIYGDHGLAYGTFQFHEDTFYRFAEEAGLEGLNWRSLDDQLKLATWAYKNGYMGHWSCWRR